MDTALHEPYTGLDEKTYFSGNIEDLAARTDAKEEIVKSVLTVDTGSSVQRPIFGTAAPELNTNILDVDFVVYFPFNQTVLVSASTQNIFSLEDVINELNRIFVLGHQELYTLEEGENSLFASELLRFINQHKVVAIEVIKTKINQGKIDVDLHSDVLAIVGKAKDAKTYSERLSLLIESLHSDIPRIRHGAIIGISFIRTPEAIPAVQRALNSENVGLLRKMLEQLVEYLSKK